MGNVPSIHAPNSTQPPDVPPNKILYQAQRPAPLNATPRTDAQGYVTFEVLVYNQNGVAPRRYKVRAPVGKRLGLHNAPFFRGILGGDPLLALLMWDDSVEIWTWVRRDTLSVDVRGTTAVVILRVPEVTLCVELGDAIDRQQFARAGTDRSKWEVLDVRVGRQTKRSGADFMVFAWGPPDEDPKLFILQLTRAGEIILADHPLLARHLGYDTENPEKNTTGYRAWDPTTCTWAFNLHDQKLVPPIGTDFALLRHGDNPVAMTLGFFLNRLEALRSRPAARLKIDLPALAKIARPVSAPEPEAQAPPLPELPTTPRRSPRNHKQVDYKKANVQGLDASPQAASDKGKKKKRTLAGPPPGPQSTHKRARVESASTGPKGNRSVASTGGAKGASTGGAKAGSSARIGEGTTHNAALRQRAKDKVARFTTRDAKGREWVDLERMLSAQRSQK